MSFSLEKKTCTKQIWQLLPYETYQGGGVKWLLHLLACFSEFEALIRLGNMFSIFPISCTGK